MSEKKELTTEILELIKKGGEFVEEQAPQLARDVIGEATLSAKIFLVVGAVLMIVSAILVYLGLEQPLDRWGDTNVSASIMYVFGGISGLIGILTVAMHGYDLVIIKKFPKLYLFNSMK